MLLSKIFRPICVEKKTRTKDSHQFCQPGENATNPVNCLMIKCLSDVDDFRLTMVVVLVVSDFHACFLKCDKSASTEQVFDDVCFDADFKLESDTCNAVHLMEIMNRSSFLKY